MNARADAIQTFAPDFTHVNMGRHCWHAHRRVTGSALPLAWPQRLARPDAATAALAGSTARST